MTTNLTVKTTIRVNGQDYASVEDMPPDLRQAYERALATLAGGKRNGLLNISGRWGDPQAVSNAKMVFNGQEYSSVDQMPGEVRRLYDAAMATLDAERRGTPGASEASGSQIGQPLGMGVESTRSMTAHTVALGAVRPEPTSRLLIAAIVIMALLLASFVFGR